MTSSDQELEQGENGNSVLMQAHNILVVKLWEIWKEHREWCKAQKIDPVIYSRVSVVSLTQIAAVTAIDVGMTEEQFLNTCKANFQEADKKAPRWG